MNSASLHRRDAQPAPQVPLERVSCCICQVDDSLPLAVGEDFEYRTSEQSFRAVRCRRCGLVYLDPRPTQEALAQIYPESYHAFAFDAERFGLVYRVRARLEARRLLGWCRGLPDHARILDVGCGDGFHLRLLAEHGPKGWTLEGLDPDPRAAAAAAQAGLVVHRGRVQDEGLPAESFDLVLLIQTLEHVGDPPGVLRGIRRLLRPGGRLVIVTDNTASPDFALFQGRHWGGYHFPRHWTLFAPETLRALAEKVELEVEELETILSPVNWVYSLRNLLCDLEAPAWLVERFSLQSPGSLALFTLQDGLLQRLGRGALLRALLRKPLREVREEPVEPTPRRRRPLPVVGGRARAPVAIVGGGLAGLTAAAALRRAGVPFLLFEKGPELAGLARSHRDADGFSYDFGAHFITNRLAAALGINERCRVVRRYGEVVWRKGRSRGYPFGLMTTPRYALSGAWAQIRLRRAPDNAAEAFRAAYGRALADEIALPLLEAWSGAPAQELAASVLAKLPVSILQTMSLKLAGKLTQRAIAVGYCRELPHSHQVWHVYPEDGVGLVCERLAEGLAGRIRLETPVEAIRVDGERVVGLRAGGEELDVSAVVSTAPANVLPRLVQGSSTLAKLRQLRFRPMVFVNLLMEGRGLLDDVVVWTPEDRFPFFRLNEAPLSMPWLAPPGKTTITVDIGCERGDPTWEMDDEALAQQCLDAIEPIVPGARARYLRCRVLRTRVAYPVFLKRYEDVRERLARGTGIAGLYSVGRGGEFDHILMEDVYVRTEARMRELVAWLDARG